MVPRCSESSEIRPRRLLDVRFSQQHQSFTKTGRNLQAHELRAQSKPHSEKTQPLDAIRHCRGVDERLKLGAWPADDERPQVP